MQRAMMLAVSTCALIAGPAIAQSGEDAPRTWKLYDVRDLIGLLPAAADVNGNAPSDAGAVDAVLTRLCDAFGAPHERLLDGVYGVEANPATHDLLMRLLSDVRALHAERFAVDIAWFYMSDGERPAIGQAVGLPANAWQHSVVVTRRTPTELEQLERHNYIKGMNVVVAESVVGYEPEIDTVVDGLRAVLTLGTSADSETSTTLRLIGEARRAKLDRKPARLESGMIDSPAVELPAQAVRTLRADVRVPFGEWTVVSAAPGFMEGMTIVIAARVAPVSVD